MKIVHISGRQVLDSRGTPTVSARVELEGGAAGEASVPSGASVGTHEAVELRDGSTAFGGKGVSKAVKHVNTAIAGKLEGKDVHTQQELDEMLIRLDGTENKSLLGANAILAVSMAWARAHAAGRGMELFEALHTAGEYVLPVPMMNILNGGAHADNNVDIQEFMVMPLGAGSMSEAVRMGAEVYAALKGELKADGLSTAVGDEGGFAPDLAADEQAIEYILRAVGRAGLRPGEDIAIALDAAATEWYAGGNVYRQPKSGREYTRESLVEYYCGLVTRYPVVSLEDGMAEDDFTGFKLLTERLPVQVVGDDLFVTNVRRIQDGIREGVANSILIKLNQIGTVSEAVRAVELGMHAGYTCVISHRSGETEDSFIADLSVALGCGQIKTGAPARGERTAKYNRLLAIEERLGTQARYAGRSALRKL